MHRYPILAAVVLASAGASLAGCPGNNSPRSGKLQTPIFEALNVQGATPGRFDVTAPTMPPPLKVLPMKGGVVQIKFSAPFGSVFSVSVRAAGATNGVQLPQDTPTQGGGYFQMVSETATKPADYVMQVQLPAFLTTPVCFPATPTGVDILVVNSSLRTDTTDSDPMIVSLAPGFSTISVTVNGPGHVQSILSVPGCNPIAASPGILCGISSQNHNLLTCTFAFPPGTVTLAPNSRDNQVDHFDGWASGCPTDPHLSCILNVDGINNPPPLTAVFSGP